MSEYISFLFDPVWVELSITCNWKITNKYNCHPVKPQAEILESWLQFYLNKSIVTLGVMLNKIMPPHGVMAKWPREAVILCWTECLLAFPLTYASTCLEIKCLIFFVR